jgi:predicted metal-dependent enzyme (double-stranded beta helix superfamily)
MEVSVCEDSTMCDNGHDHAHDKFGFIVDTPEVRALIDETRRQMDRDIDNVDRVDALKPAFAKLLAADNWLPESYAVPDEKSRMGDGIGQYALYRAEDGSLCLFSLVVPADASTPVHDHLAWGLVGVYRGEQDETVYRRLDDESDPTRADLEVSKRQTLKPGDLYPLIPPTDDIHYVKTVSPAASISIHLLANDTACVWRHKFDPGSGVVTPFRSGYANAPCPSDAASTTG